jgi:hypothetical protein
VTPDKSIILYIDLLLFICWTFSFQIGNSSAFVDSVFYLKYYDLDNQLYALDVDRPCNLILLEIPSYTLLYVVCEVFSMALSDLIE